MKKLFMRWEWLLVLMIAAVYLFFHFMMPQTYTLKNLLGQTRVYMVDVGFLALGAMLILILGDIDISVASTAGLSVTIMAVTYNAGDGIPFWVSMMLALVIGAVCGALNGLLITRFKELFAMIITLSTMTLYRGIAYIILKDQSAGGFPAWFTKDLGYGTIGATPIPIMLLFILAMFPLFHVLLHKTASGRRLFATGANISTARYSGVRTDRMKLIIFIINGVLAAVCGIFLSARTGSVKYTIATGFEMQAIAIAVLGGASPNGGKGSVPGVFLSLVLMTFLKNGLTLLFNDQFILNLSVGALLIGVVLVPNMIATLREREAVARRRRETQIESGGAINTPLK
ncbi:MAG: ABC transporter permease [Christensenellales bacterium]|jgi:rhamnose transport system permease protein